MDDDRVLFARSARKALETPPNTVVMRVLKRIETLATTPRRNGCRKLAGSDNLWRIRIGDYRVIYSIDDVQRIVDVNGVRHRKDAYE
jgi:mRNA interferase RelE/StbE